MEIFLFILDSTCDVLDKLMGRPTDYCMAIAVLMLVAPILITVFCTLVQLLATNVKAIIYCLAFVLMPLVLCILLVDVIVEDEEPLVKGIVRNLKLYLRAIKLLSEKAEKFH